jgi:hypothetical protein
MVNRRRLNKMNKSFPSKQALGRHEQTNNTMKTRTICNPASIDSQTLDAPVFVLCSSQETFIKSLDVRHMSGTHMLRMLPAQKLEAALRGGLP